MYNIFENGVFRGYLDMRKNNQLCCVLIFHQIMLICLYLFVVLEVTIKTTLRKLICTDPYDNSKHPIEIGQLIIKYKSVGSFLFVL